MAEMQTAFNPFPGLRPFEPHENHLFFGRDGQSQELLRKLRRNRFVAVVGNSGSGKSSLVHAGLLPALYGGFMAKAGSIWRVARLRPGHDPIGNLARALNEPGALGREKVGVIDQTMVTEVTLRRGNLGLVEFAKQARMPAGENLLIVVDQFEELFRFQPAGLSGRLGNDAVAFVALLLQASKRSEVPIYVVVTMRSDYLGDCAQFRDLPEAMNEGQYLIPRMTRDQRRAAIVGPIAVGGGQISEGLAQQLLNDVGDSPDQLPILQHALMRTWHYWTLHKRDSEAIDLQHYEFIGGMNEALSLHVEEALSELPDERSKQIAEKLFKALTEKGPDNREIRRPTKLGVICAITESDETETIAIIDAFRRQGRSFLMPPVEMRLDKETLIDISHESLIRNWRRLKQWVDEEAQSAYVYRRLAETAVLHREGKAGLWRDPDLQFALIWRERVKPNQAWARGYHPEYDSAMAFLDRSRQSSETEQEEQEAARQRELQQALALTEEQKKAKKRLQLAMALLTFLLLALSAAIFAIFSQQIAKRDALLATQGREQAEKEAAAADSARNASERSRLQADSLKDAEKIARLEAEEQSQLALLARDSASVARQRAQEQARLAEQRRVEALAARDTARINQEQVQAVALATKSQRQVQLSKDTLAVLLALESYRFDQNSGGHFHNEAYHALRNSLNALDANSGGPLRIQVPTASITASAFSSVANRVAWGGLDSTVQVLKLSEIDRPWRLGKHKAVVTALEFSLDGKSLASGGADFSIIYWHLHEDSYEAKLLARHRGDVLSLAFSPQGDYLVSSGADSVVVLWNLQQNLPGKLLGKHQGSVKAAAFSPGGNLLASAGTDKRVLLWKLLSRGLQGPPDTLQFVSESRALAFSPNGETLAVGCEDGTTQLVALQQRNFRMLRGHQRRVNAVAFSPDGRLLASGSSDKTVRLWNLQRLSIDPIVFSEHKSSILSVAFTAHSDSLVAGTFGKEIVVWQVVLADLVRKARQRVKRNLSLDEWREFVGPEIEYRK